MHLGYAILSEWIFLSLSGIRISSSSLSFRMSNGLLFITFHPSAVISSTFCHDTIQRNLYYLDIPYIISLLYSIHHIKWTSRPKYGSILECLLRYIHSRVEDKNYKYSGPYHISEVPSGLIFYIMMKHSHQCIGQIKVNDFLQFC